MYSKIKKKIALLIAGMMIFPGNFGGNTAQGENINEFLTNVRIEDKFENNLSNQQIHSNTEMTIVYSYEVNKNNINQPEEDEEQPDNGLELPEDKDDIDNNENSNPDLSDKDDNINNDKDDNSNPSDSATRC